MTSGWLFLGTAIACEIVATSALKMSAGMTRTLWAALSIAGYLVAFWALAKSLQTIPLGIAYAIWSAVGIVVLLLIGTFWFREAISWQQGAGVGLILAGVAAIYFA